SIVAEVGADPLIQWRTYPIDGENPSELLSEVREDLKSEILAIEREAALAAQTPVAPPAEVPSAAAPYEQIAETFIVPQPISEGANPSQPMAIMHDTQPEEEPFFEFVIEEEEIIRDGDHTMSNMGAHVPPALLNAVHTPTEPPAAEPVKSPEVVEPP